MDFLEVLGVWGEGSVWGWGCLFCQKKVSERSEFFFQRKGSPTPEPAPKDSGNGGCFKAELPD